MKKVLYIKANPKSVKESVTFQVSEAFIKEYKKKNPDDKVTTLDLYKSNVDFIREEDMGVLFSGKPSKMLRHAENFKKFDKYVFAAPLWNFGVPAILKAYIDYITLPKVTFHYTKVGLPIGLLKHKKALFISARGGVYSTGLFERLEMCTRYLREALAFMGVIRFKAIEIEELSMGEERAKKSFDEALESAVKLAKKW